MPPAIPNRAPGGPLADERIVLDDRERPSGLFEAIRQCWGFQPKIERLPLGDILIARRVLVERKSAPDFIASMRDGRLFDQAAGIRNQRFEPLMIIEGEFTEEICSGTTPEALRGAMLAVTLDWGIPILRSRSIEETARWLVSILSRGEKKSGRPDWRGISSTGQRLPPSAIPRRPERKKTSPLESKRKQALAVLMQLEGLGEGRSQALLERFGSLGAILKAKREELIEVAGVGRGLAEQIHSILHAAED